MIHFVWRFFIYTPLQNDIKNLVTNGDSSIKELGPIGQTLQDAFVRIRKQESALQKKLYEEERVTNALRVAHDILTPVRSIQSLFAKMPERLRHEVENIEGIALSLLPEKSLPSLKVFSLRELVLTAATRTGHADRFTMNVAKDLFIQASEMHFQRAIINILNNALEAKANSPVEITAESKKENITLYVRDYGAGIPLHLTGDIPTSKPNGSGLGIGSARENFAMMKASLSYAWAEPGTIAQITAARASKITNAILIEDDKYVRAQWQERAKQVGINLTVYSEIPKVLPDADAVYVDRFLGETDSNEWSKRQVENGINVIRISAIDGAKTPPWA
jgi:hypothetical protein